MLKQALLGNTSNATTATTRGATSTNYKDTRQATDMIEQSLLTAYDDHGPQGVFDWVRTHRPNWEWTACEPCEEATPTWDGACAVCFTDKEGN